MITLFRLYDRLASHAFFAGLGDFESKKWAGENLVLAKRLFDAEMKKPFVLPNKKKVPIPRKALPSEAEAEKVMRVKAALDAVAVWVKNRIAEEARNEATVGA